MPLNVFRTCLCQHELLPSYLDRLIYQLIMLPNIKRSNIEENYVSVMIINNQLRLGFISDEFMKVSRTREI